MHRLPADRPRILSHAIPLVRDGETVQLGLWAGDAVVLGGLTSAEVDLVTGLDGTRDRRQVLRDGGGDRDEALLGVLEDAGALAGGGGAPARRTGPPEALVLVHGAGRLADDIALQLSGHQVARVVRGERTVPDLWTGDPPALVVLVEHRAVGPDRRAEVEALGVPVLPVVHDGPHGIVGPLVVPGVSACLGCLDLTRADHDPAWDSLLRQATTWSVRPDLVETGPDPELAALLGATAVMVAACAVRGASPSGVSLEVSLPWPRHVQRRWSPHPACGCGADARAASVTMGA